MFPNENPWYAVKDGDPTAFSLYKNHYSYRTYRDNRRQQPGNRARRLFVGPGEKLVLLTSDSLALFVWRKFIDKSGQNGINCAIFRNEGPQLSSVLIRAAEVIAWDRYPGQRLYTYVNPRKVTSSNPGYCFISAGWHKCGYTANGLLILEKEVNK